MCFSIGVGPAWTFPAKPKEKVEELPGPGEYTIPREIATGEVACMHIPKQSTDNSPPLY
jgi:hypothetical protein